MLTFFSKLFDRLCKLKELMADYKRRFTQDYQSKRQKLSADVEEAEKSNDEEAIAAAKLDLQHYERSYHKMRKFTKNYKIHYERTLFIVAVTLAHECFHVLTGYWTGNDKEVTPPKFFGQSLNKDKGEAGEWWEVKHGFKGSANLVWNNLGKDKDDPYPLDDEKMSAGIPFLKQIRRKDDGSVDGVKWTRISHGFIRDVLEKGWSHLS